MYETYTVTAKTVEEAIEKATELYGGENKEVKCEIVSMPKKGLLGIGSKDAVVKVTVEENVSLEIEKMFGEIRKSSPSAYDIDEPEKKSEKQAKGNQNKNTGKKSNEQKSDGSRKLNQEKPKKEKAAKRAPEESSLKETKNNEENKAAAEVKKDESKTEEANRPDAENQVIKEKTNDRAREKEYKKAGVSETEMKYALEFLNVLIADLGLNLKAEATDAPEGEEYEKTDEAPLYPAINITGENTGILIGHHGETLDAIQYLVNLSSQRRTVGRRGYEPVRITVDVENYRERRKKTLKQLARRMAAKAVRYKKNVFLDPMNPYERRIIHSELQDFENVSTHSVGTDKNRKVIITYEGPGKKKNAKNNRDQFSDMQGENE